MSTFDPISGAPISSSTDEPTVSAAGLTSGVAGFNATRDQIIRQAALHIGVISAGVTMNAQMLSDFAHNLNGMIKRWQAQQLHVWTVREGVLFPAPGQIKYGAGGGVTDNLTEFFVSTSMSAAAVVGATVLDIDDPSDILDGDNIGILLDNGTLQWSVASSVTSTTVTIADALTDSAAAGNNVFAYTERLLRPLKVVSARRFDIISETEVPVTVMARRDYHDLVMKTGAGSINQMFYDPQLTTGFFYLWRVPAATTELLRFTWHRPIMDFAVGGNYPDLPQEWVQTIEFNLAAVMASQFAIPDNRFNRIVALAAQFLDELRGFDHEAEAIDFQPDMEGR